MDSKCCAERVSNEILLGKITKLERTIARLEALVCYLANRDSLVMVDDKEYRLVTKGKEKFRPEHIIKTKPKKPSREPSLFDNDLPF